MRCCFAITLSLAGLLPAALSAQSVSPQVEVSAQVRMDARTAEFGGLSGLAVAPNGRRAWVVSDRGRLFDVVLRRDVLDTLEDVEVQSTQFLYLDQTTDRPDTEGLAVLPDGDVMVSSENPPALLRYAARNSRPTERIATPPLARENRGIEALARDAEGHWIALPEVVASGTSHFPVLRHGPGGWSELARLPRDGAFSVVGADLGPEGRLYVLERAVSLLGFRTRVRRMTLPPAATMVETLFGSKLTQFDNLEGISVWVDTAGQTRILMVSDNNFWRIWRTEFVELILRE